MDMMEELNRGLLEAAESGDTKSVEDWVARGADVNCKDGYGWSPLHVASGYGHTETVSRLVSLGADIHIKDNNDGYRPLHWASQYGHTETVTRLVSLGADINSKTDNKYGWSPLHYASVRGHTETVSRLVSLGADIHSQDNMGKTPYDVALNDEIKELLKKASDHGVQQSDQDITVPKIEDATTFKTLLSDGEYESYGNRIYLAGACNVGKSTLASLLIGDEIPLKWKSTDGLRIYFGRNGIDVKEMKMVPLKKGQGVLSHVLCGNPDIKQDQSEKRRNDTASDQSDNADLSSLKPGQSPPGKESPSTSSQEKGKRLVDKKLPSIEFLKIHEDIKAEIRKGEYKVHIAPSDLVDFGGQKSYDMTHQLFIQGKGTFTLMFDGKKSLQEPLTEEYPAGDVTTESILKHWVESILTYCGVDDDDEVPVILFVATHRDRISNEDEQSKIQEFKEGLSRMFQTHERCNRIKYSDLFFINATDKNDPEVERLKAKYVDIARKQNSWGKKMPMAWVPLELQMSSMREENKSIISKEELKEVNEANADLALTEQQLEQFLKEQHSLGKILYFGGQGLGNYIIVQPTTLVDILRSFITDERFFPSNENLAQILKDLTKSGKITKLDLFRLWSQDDFHKHMPTNDFKEFVAKVLVHLDLLVEPKSGKVQPMHSTEQSDSSKFYLVPCAVKYERSTDVLKNLGTDKTLYMSYKLSKSSIPSALIFKLIGAVLNVWPLKKIDEQICLFHKAAILDIDKDNELHILGRDDRVFVCLFNKTTRGFISPDIASCTQECLTLAMTTALEFYHNTFGNIVSYSEVAKLLQIEGGEKCGTDLCYYSLSDAKTKPSWTCTAGNVHKTEKLLYWSHDKKKVCPAHCKGLDNESLQLHPADKHLARLALLIGIQQFRDFVIRLGLSADDWEGLEYKHQRCDLNMMRIDALYELKKKVKNPTFQDLQDAVTGINKDYHLLCQIFREDTQILEIEHIKLQNEPDTNTLKELSRNIGNCALHLGVELGLATVDIEESIFKHSKDMFAQNCDILTKWSKSGSNKTLRSLIKTLQIVDRRGARFLDETFEIGLS